MFDELGVDIIEAGFPIASPGDFEAVTEISKILKKSIPAGLSRHSKKDIDRCYEALKHAPRFRIHTFISTSPLHMKHKLNMTKEQVYDSVKEHVTYARKFTDDVEWSCEDGTRTDMDYMCKTVELAIKCGAKTVNIPDAYKDDRFNPAFDKETNYRTKSILCMPMLNNEGALVGVVQVLNKKDGSTFDEKDESLLEALSVQAGVAIQRARLLEAFVEKQRIQESLKLAADIQMGMLPKDFPAFPDRDDFDLFASIIPAKEVGGDFYDFFLIDDDHLCFVIGDVSGKGVTAALFMAVTKTHVAASTTPGTAPSDILVRANDELGKENDPGMFCTIFYGILNTKTGTVRYSNGGHNPPYLVRADGSNEQLEGTEGIALGVMDGMDFGVNTLTLGKGEAIYLYTDGVNEAMDDGGNEYSYERLEEFLKMSKGQSITEIVNGSLDDVSGFVKNAEQSDDITVLAVRYNG